LRVSVLSIVGGTIRASPTDSGEAADGRISPRRTGRHLTSPRRVVQPEESNGRDSGWAGGIVRVENGLFDCRAVRVVPCSNSPSVTCPKSSIAATTGRQSIGPEAGWNPSVPAPLFFECVGHSVRVDASRIADHGLRASLIVVTCSDFQNLFGRSDSSPIDKRSPRSVPE
jgi:hypothetical protein